MLSHAALCSQPLALGSSPGAEALPAELAPAGLLAFSHLILSLLVIKEHGTGVEEAGLS